MNRFLILIILVTLFSCSKEDDKTNTPVSNPIAIAPPNTVYIMSVVATPTTAESITLKNNSGSSADIGGWTLGDINDPVAYNIPQNTILSNGSTKKFNRTTIGFQINDSGEIIYLKDSNGNNIHSWGN